MYVCIHTQVFVWLQSIPLILVEATSASCWVCIEECLHAGGEGCESMSARGLLTYVILGSATQQAHLVGLLHVVQMSIGRPVRVQNEDV